MVQGRVGMGCGTEGGGATLSAIVPGCGTDRMPLWLAALIAAPCEACGVGDNHAVSWQCISGRAFYTNASLETEMIEPLGVRLRGGHTLAVSWMPGATGYTVEVFRQFDYQA
jgi:hypothetical protein